MPTMDDFESLVIFWCDKMGDPALREKMRGSFAPLRQAYQNALTQPNEKAVKGILRSIQCYELPGPLLDFLKVSQWFCAMPVRMHRKMASGRGYEVISPPFFETASLFRDRESLLVTLKSLTSIANLPQAVPHLGAYFSCAVMDVAHNILYDGDMCPRDRDRLIAARIDALARFVYTVKRELPALAVEYDEWEPTGSDPHCQGRTVLLLRKGALCKVLKPRETVADQSLTALLIGVGANGILATVNRMMTEQRMELFMPLPTLEVSCMAGLSYGLEEFAVKKGALTPMEAGCYFQQMGALAFLAKLFGCTDLHQDNVMVTAKGPVILDAECLFLPHIITSDDLNATGLGDAANGRPNALQEPSPSHFQLNGELFPGVVQTSYCAGFSLMQQLCGKAGLKGRLLQAFLDALIRRPTVRIVPVDTSVFAADLLSYPQVGEDMVIDIVKQITDALGDKLLLSPDSSFIEAGLAREALRMAFLQGDIPTLQIRIEPGNDSPFFINGRQVGVYTGYKDLAALRKAFEDNLDWLCSLKPDDLPVLAPSFG